MDGAEPIQAYETLRLERGLPASPERVFAAWTDPTQIARWFGPEGVTVAEALVDLRVGGAWSITISGTECSSMRAEGVYLALDPPRLLRTTWSWRDPDGAPGPETELEIRIVAAPTGARLTLIHSRFADRPARDSHEHGWTGSLDKLGRLLADPDA